MKTRYLILLAFLVCVIHISCLFIFNIFDEPTVQDSNVTVSVKEVPPVIQNEIVETTPPTESEEDLAHQLEEEEWLGELELLATLVEAEAGNQDLQGKRLVADVVLNRMESDRFPNTISEVIYQDNQFSTVADGALDKASFHISDDSFKAVSMEALESEERLDEKVLFFTYGGYNPYCTPGYQYQDHYFGY